MARSYIRENVKGKSEVMYSAELIERYRKVALAKFNRY